jgi:hypothetical protein
MPAEAARLEREVGRRDRRFLAALACAAVIGTPVAVLIARHDSKPASRSGAACIDAPHAGVLGGGAYHYCGAEAAAFCRRFASEDWVAAKCEELGQASGTATSAGRLRRSHSVAFRKAAETTRRAMMYSQSRITVAAPSAP